MIVFSAGISATKLVLRLGLDRSIQLGLALACLGGAIVLLVALFDGRFLPFLAGACVFLLGMGMVNPLCSAQTLSSFGDRAAGRLGRARRCPAAHREDRQAHRLTEEQIQAFTTYIKGLKTPE